MPRVQLSELEVGRSICLDRFVCSRNEITKVGRIRYSNNGTVVTSSKLERENCSFEKLYGGRRGREARDKARKMGTITA